MIAEFREFINRGNFVDLAIAFVMGVAVTNVINTIVERAIMPLIAWVFGEPNFDDVLTFGPVVTEDGVVVGQTGSLGAVLTALVNFFLIALVLFLIVRAYNRMQRDVPDEPEPEADPDEVVLLREIRDALAGASGTPPTGKGPGDAR